MKAAGRATRRADRSRPRPARARRPRGVPLARPTGSASGSRARPPRGSPRCSHRDVALLDERGGEPRDHGERWPCSASQGLPQVPLEEGMGHRPEETGPLIPDRLREPEHVREPVRGGTAVPASRRDGLSRGRLGASVRTSTMLMTESLPGISTAIRGLTGCQDRTHEGSVRAAGRRHRPRAAASGRPRRRVVTGTRHPHVAETPLLRGLSVAVWR